MELEIWWIGKTKDIYFARWHLCLPKEISIMQVPRFVSLKEAKGLKSIDSDPQFEEPMLKALQTPVYYPVLLDEIGTHNKYLGFATWCKTIYNSQ